jgi:DNA-binding beta-propeller fold protein YncE
MAALPLPPAPPLLPHPARRTRTRALLALGALLCGAAGCAPEGPQALLVSLPAADAVARVDPRTGALLGQTEVGMLPHHLLLAPGGTTAFVALTGSQAVAEVDLATGALLRTMLTAPLPLAREDGTPIAAHAREGAAAQTTCFACHGTRAGGARPAVVGSRPFGLALSADGSRLFVANIKGGALSRIRLSDGALEALLPLGPTGEAREPTALARLGDSLFVTLLPVLPSDAPAVVRRLSADGERVLGEVATGPNAGALRADPARGQVWVSNFETNTVTRLSAGGERLGVLEVGNGPLGALVADGGALLVANYYDNSLSRVDPEGGAVTTVPLALGDARFPNPTHLARAGGALYALSSGTSGHLLTLDPATLAVTRAVKVGGLPFDLLAAPSGKDTP